MSTVKIGNKNILIKDLIIACIIIALPFLFYLYRLAPHTKMWETSWFTFNSGKYDSVKFYFWIINTKLLIILILILWFMTCRNWWRYSILILITIELFKFHSIFNDNLNYLDEVEFIHSIPITLPIIIFLIYLTKKLNFYSLSLDLSHDLNEEIDNLFYKLKLNDEKSIDAIKKKYNNLKRRKANISFDEYMNELLALRQKLFEL